MRAYQDRHQNKDTYDLIFCLLNYGRGPEHAAAVAAGSPIRDHPIVVDGVRSLEERFADVDRDGPGAYATFLADEGDTDAAERLRREAVATVRQFMEAYRSAMRRIRERYQLGGLKTDRGGRSWTPLAQRTPRACLRRRPPREPRGRPSRPRARRDAI